VPSNTFAALFICPHTDAPHWWQMWQFGCLLYVLCTGFSLFTVDNQENVRPEELHKIAAWDDDEKAHKMASIGKGWPRRLISSLLSRDPQQRPRSWDYVLKQLGVQKSSRKAVNTRACSVYHLTDVLRPACDAELEKRLAGIGEPLEGMDCVEDGKIWCQLCQLLEPEILVCVGIWSMVTQKALVSLT